MFSPLGDVSLARGPFSEEAFSECSMSRAVHLLRGALGSREADRNSLVSAKESLLTVEDHLCFWEPSFKPCCCARRSTTESSTPEGAFSPLVCWAETAPAVALCSGTMSLWLAEEGGRPYEAEVFNRSEKGDVGSCGGGEDGGSGGSEDGKSGGGEDGGSSLEVVGNLIEGEAKCGRNIPCSGSKLVEDSTGG